LIPKNRKTITLVTVSLVVLLFLGMSLWFAFKMSPSELIVKTVTITMTTSEVTASRSTSGRAIILSLWIEKERISTGGVLWFSVSTKWQDDPLVTSLRIAIINPSGQVAYDYKRETSSSGIANMNWLVPRNATLGIYTLAVTASKEGYISVEARRAFEVIW